MEPIAIVGMACRFPKGLEDLERLWEALKSRTSAIDTVPADRWTADRYYSSNPIAKGKSYIRRGGFLSHPIETFDPGFFGISPRDAENMDPQQRLLLEVVWEAFENSGISLPDQAGHAVGVYVGGFMLDHMITQMSAPNRSAINQNTAAGMMMTMLSNRISHTFDLRGPSLSIDTACSSSLVAFHYACQDIWRGTTEMAIVGGANCMLRPEYPMGMCKGHFLSRDGECKSFDERADGYGRGEGAGAVLLKPLAKAIEDGDPILATVIATGTNQDGHTPGISMPSGEAQQALIEQVCRDYDIDPATISYVECHGTGTAVGDPTETKAIGQTYGRARSKESPVIVGSIKSNIGHLEAAAGVAGIIKAVLTLIHRTATPIANLQSLNPSIDLPNWNVRVATDLISLSDDDSTIRCAVNSFGYGGSNAHVILETAPTLAKNVDAPALPSIRSNDALSLHYLPISARSDSSLQKIAKAYHEKLKGECDINDFLYSVTHHRAHLNHRAMAFGKSREDLLAALQSIADAQENPNVVRNQQPFNGHRKPVFVFTGMGPQWWAMGQELYATSQTYKNAVDEADEIFKSISGFSILEQMLKPESESVITRTEYAQPANFLLQIGLMAILNEQGVEPGAVVGHSVGELASAYASKVLSLHDALKVCYHRSRLQATCIGTGGMMAVGLSKSDMIARLGEYADRVSIAAANGPTNITIAGDLDALADIAESLRKEDIFHKQLDVEVPYHSPMMEPIMEELQSALAMIQPNNPLLPLYSTVTGAKVTEASYGADYWPLNVRQPVEFESAVYALLKDGFNTFLEIGPHPVLATSIRDCCKNAGKEIRQLYTLRRNQPELLCVSQAIAGAYAVGCDMNWDRIQPNGKFISLPNYQWSREMLWNETARAHQDRIASIDYPMLGIQEAPGTPAWRNDFDHEPVLYLRDHVVTGMPILPAAGYIENMLELAHVQLEQGNACYIRNLRIAAPMLITAERGLDCVTTFETQSNLAVVRSLENGKLGSGTIHASGSISRTNVTYIQRLSLESFEQEFTTSLDIGDFYQSLRSIGLEYGPAFQTLREVRLNKDHTKVLARIEMDSMNFSHTEKYYAHPTTLDACFQSLMSMLTNSDQTYLPSNFQEICLLNDQLPSKFWCLGELVSMDERTIVCDLTIVDDRGCVCMTIHGMESIAASRRERTDQFGDKVKRQILAYQWNYDAELNEPKRLGHWMIVGDSQGLQEELTRGLEHYGAHVVAKVAVSDIAHAEGIEFSVRSGSKEDYLNVLSSCGDLDGIVYLNGLSSTPSSFDPTGEKAILDLTSLLQAYLTAERSTTPRFYVITQSAFATESNSGYVAPGQSAINGAVRVAFNELDKLQASTIDLPLQIDESIVEKLVLELVCDDQHDEVVLTGSMRLASELLESDMLSAEQIEYRYLTDSQPVLVRPIDPNDDSIGTAKVVEHSYPCLNGHDVRVRIEAMVMPPELFTQTAIDDLDSNWIEFIGEIIACGDCVQHHQVGTRVIGFAPVEIASHLQGHEDQFRCLPLASDLNNPELLGQLAFHVRATSACRRLRLAGVRTAVVEASALGLAIAEYLQRQNIQIHFVGSSREAISSTKLEDLKLLSDSASLHRAFVQETSRNGFDLIVASLKSWNEQYGFSMLANGAQFVDTDVQGVSCELPSSASAVIRTDLNIIQSSRAEFLATLEETLALYQKNELTVTPCLVASIADLAWQKLPLSEVKGALVLTFETKGRDLPVVKAPKLNLDSNSTYLITGGFGGLGYKTAEWLIKNGVRNLVLTGRKGADTEDKRVICKTLEDMGATVHAVACDSSDASAVEKLINMIQTTMPPLKGVIHSGAVILDQPIAEIDENTLKQVMRSKALGAWNLHNATKDLTLDHFVMYSSVANLVGNSRQAIYSAANGFLNGLAYYRRSLGLAGLSVNWGAIRDVGVVARDEKLEQFLRYTGLRGIESREGLELLGQAMAREVTQFGVTIITSWTDWARFETRGSKSPRFATLIANDSAGKDSTMRDALIEELSKLDAADQIELLSTLIGEIIGAVLKLDASSIPFEQSLSQFGVDSLMATEIQMTLDAKLGINVSVLELIGESTIRSISKQAQQSLCSDLASAT